jgi:hypothetical protein
MVISKHDRTPLEYESPSLLELGTVHDLTLIDKDYGPTDGMTFQGIAITNASR